jgi:hypothetical protein
MQTADALRRQAERCLVLAQTTDSRKIAAMLMGLRRQLLEQAAEAAGQRHPTAGRPILMNSNDVFVP